MKNRQKPEMRKRSSWREEQISHSYIHDELRRLIIMQSVRMTWVLFWFSLFMFAIVLALLFYSITFNKGDVWTKFVLALINGIVGRYVWRIVVSFFPGSGD
jgi:hypothetical protein